MNHRSPLNAAGVWYYVVSLIVSMSIDIGVATEECAFAATRGGIVCPVRSEHASDVVALGVSPSGVGVGPVCYSKTEYI